MNTDLGKTTLRLAVIWGVFFSLNALGTCIVASLTNVKWSDIDQQAKLLLVTVVFINWSGTMMAFLSKTVARLEAGKQPPTNGTDFFTKPEPSTPELPAQPKV